MNWINVNDRVPEEPVDVIIWASGLEIGCYYPDSKEWVIYSTDEKNKVTYWMPVTPPQL